MKYSTDTFYQRDSNIVSSEIENETVMMDKDFDRYLGLDVIGTRVWQLLEQPISIQQIAKQLTLEYDVSLEQCLNDLKPLMSEFLKNELVVQA